MFADMQGLQSDEEEKKRVSSRFMFVFNYIQMHACTLVLCDVYNILISCAAPH